MRKGDGEEEINRNLVIVPFCRGKKRGRKAIFQKGKILSDNASHNPGDKRVTKTQINLEQFDVKPSYPVKIFGEIHYV